MFSSINLILDLASELVLSQEVCVLRDPSFFVCSIVGTSLGMEGTVGMARLMSVMLESCSVLEVK